MTPPYQSHSLPRNLHQHASTSFLSPTFHFTTKTLLKPLPQRMLSLSLLSQQPPPPSPIPPNAMGPTITTTAIPTQASPPPSSSSSAALKFPPGCRFYPSDQELLAYYLSNKNQNENQSPNPKDCSFNCNVIQEFNLYDCFPFELPESLCFVYGKGGSKKHWFFYTVRVKEGNEKKSRKVRGGFWKRKGKVREIKGKEAEGVNLGSRIRFVFYQGKCLKCCVRTQWVMYEYNLLDHLKGSFVVCRIYAKPQRQNTTSTNILRTFAEDSDLAIYRRDNPENGPVAPEIVESDTSNVNYNIHLRINISSESHDLDRPIVAELTLPLNFQIPPENHATEPVRSTGLADEGRTSHDDIARQQLVSFLEDDFIELDDLIDPI